MGIQYACKNEERRDLVKDHDSLNGIDFLEVLDDDTLPIELRQCTLEVHLIRPLDGSITLEKENFRIDGGVRIRNIKIIDPPIPDGAREIITLQVDRAGDFSTYTLRIFKDPDLLTYLDTFDPILSEVDFSFKVECPSEFDCKIEEKCPSLTYPAPEINYLAKDYAGFRRLMLDRLSLLMPGWRERNPADLQVALVELLAYVGDYLSYYQDAVATEAYLGTARKRVSVRRHARLVDYHMHDGCNARAWVHLQLEAGSLTIVEKTKLMTRCLNADRVIAEVAAEKIIKQQKPVVFETMFPIDLYQAHNKIRFYTWGDSECCLPKGAVKATLYEKSGMLLKIGDFLLFEEVKSPVTGEPEDSDPTHRHVVRLVDVEPTTDPLDEIAVVNIRWHEEDALPFPFCISTVIREGGLEEAVTDASVARGNLVPADHGQTIIETDTFSPDQIKNRLLQPLELGKGPVTCTDGFDAAAGVSAASAKRRKLHRCCPAVVLVEDPGGGHIEWEARQDLLNSEKFSKEFVVETEPDGTAYVRFGDGILGKEPDTDKTFGASYRVGNGSDGNVGAGALCHIVPKVGGSIGISAVRNPLPAEGGVEMETIEEARQFAPQAFRTQERAVTEKDYADVAMRYPGIQKAVATFKWTGSWFTIFLVVDREGGKPVEEDPQFKEDLYKHLEKYRMAGFDLELDDPVSVPLDIALRVCVKPGYFKSDIKEALLKVFSNYEWEPGQRGFFHPDNFTFAQPVYLSRIYEAAVKVDGVASVNVTKFERWGKGPDKEIEDGRLVPGRTEIVRLDNDPNFQENGKIEFEMKGGM
jgi:hypothetical protein